jgi:hypothetical protein
MTFSILTFSKLAILALVTVGSNVMGLAHPVIEERAAAPITLGAAAAFGISAATTITNGGLSVITGECGVCPGSAVTGFPPGKCSGATSLNTAPACTAGAACAAAFNASFALVPTPLPSPNLAGQILAPGVYSFPTSGVTNSAVLTLNGATNANGQWVFHITTTLITAALSQVVLTNGAQAKNVFFVVGTSATLGANSVIQGNLIAHTSVSFGGGAKVVGTVCAITAAVTLSDNAVGA